MYQRYRRQGLEDNLEEIAQRMEDTLLQQALAESFFDETLEIDQETKDAVRETLDALRAADQDESRDYDAVEERIEELQERVESEETRIANRIQQLRIKRQEKVSGMRRLNERVERVDSTQLEALENLLENWNWKKHVYSERADTYTERREEAIQYGEDMSFVFDQLKTDLFEVYDGTELRPLVNKLLDDKRLTLGSLTETEQRQLAQSDLSAYIELKLS
jgi:chemotaxis protein histidine kinase CheA